MVSCGIKRCPPTPFDINRLHHVVALSRQRSRVRVSSSPPYFSIHLQVLVERSVAQNGQQSRARHCCAATYTTVSVTVQTSRASVVGEDGSIEHAPEDVQNLS